jgi:hypothetical protein
MQNLRNFPPRRWLKYCVHVVRHDAPRKQPIANAIEMEQRFRNYGRCFGRSQKASTAPAIETLLQPSMNLALQ